MIPVDYGPCIGKISNQLNCYQYLITENKLVLLYILQKVLHTYCTIDDDIVTMPCNKHE